MVQGWIRNKELVILHGGAMVVKVSSLDNSLLGMVGGKSEK